MKWFAENFLKVFMTLEERLIKAKEYKGLKPEQLAPLCGFSARSWYYYEKDASKIQADKIVKIATACSVNLIWLLTGQGEMTQDKSQAQNKPISQSDVVRLPPILEKHIETIQQFHDHEAAADINNDLLYLERKNRAAFDKARHLIKGLKMGVELTQQTPAKDEKKTGQNESQHHNRRVTDKVR